MNTQILNECTHGSLEETLKFPQIILKLIEAGVERYYVDLIRMEIIYYMKNDETYITRLITPSITKINNKFDDAQLQQAIHASQRDEINFIAFLEKIMAFGITSYIVYIEGKQAVYFGRRGEMHTEKFPQ